MHKLVDKLLLLGLCTLAMSLSDIHWMSVVAMLGAVATGSLNSYVENRLPVFLSAAYVAACFIAPEFAVFLPLIAYDCAGMGSWLLRFCWCAALPTCYSVGGWRTTAAVTLSCVAAYMLQYRTSAALKTQSAYYSLADEAKEKAASLERKQHELLEKQGYEVRLATLAERNRIAREIHDNVGHLLTRSILQIGALRAIHAGGGKPDGLGGGGKPDRLASGGKPDGLGGGSKPDGLDGGGKPDGLDGGGKPDGLADELDLVDGTLREAMDSIRSSVHGLHDESVNLQLQLETMISGFRFCPVRLRYDAGALPVELRICFAAIVREALSNIARHSGASEASVTVVEHPALCQLIVWDNGAGGGIADGGTARSGAAGMAGGGGVAGGGMAGGDGTARSGAAGMATIYAYGIGLQNMADRVESLGGIFRVERSSGFKIFISVPIAAPLVSSNSAPLIELKEAEDEGHHN